MLQQSFQDDVYTLPILPLWIALSYKNFLRILRNFLFCRLYLKRISCLIYVQRFKLFVTFMLCFRPNNYE
jgi:hypothetical protein